MKVKELIETLNKIEDKEKEICISVDEEGNNFKEIHEVVKATDEEMGNLHKIDGYIIYPLG